ncbi:MAG: hypothetical protein HC896_00305 [Bacteroidales bacterium]|nr:hypothetical protein [Bacteroidales bacterium]
MTTRYPFVISDENVVNSYGFRVLTAGIDLAQYERNPLVIWMHRRATEAEDKDSLPIGLAYNLKKENGKLIAEVEFDGNDEFAQKIEGKVKTKHIRMASPGLTPIEWSKTKTDLLPGQTAATLAKSKLVEISIVDIGSNDNALMLYDGNGNTLQLSAGANNGIIPLANDNQKDTKDSKMEFQKQVAVLLGLDPNTSADAVINSLKPRIELAAKADTYKTEAETLKGEVANINKANIVALVDGAVDKKITADKRDFYVRLGTDSGMDTLKGVLDNMLEIKGITQQLNFKANPGGQTLKIEKWEDITKLGIDAVAKLKKEQPSEYIKLFTAEYGFAPKLTEDN